MIAQTTADYAAVRAEKPFPLLRARTSDTQADALDAEWLVAMADVGDVARLICALFQLSRQEFLGLVRHGVLTPEGRFTGRSYRHGELPEELRLSRLEIQALVVFLFEDGAGLEEFVELAGGRHEHIEALRCSLRRQARAMTNKQG